LLARHFLDLFARESGSTVHEISESAMRMLAAREYPGNVRQLANVIQRAVLLAGDTGRIDPDHLSCAEPDAVGQAARQARSGPLKEHLARVERVLIVQALDQNDGNRTHAAKQLGITRQALLGKLNKYDIR
jgi:transcriptional regulator with PAS, ATPase and Fis domain